MSTQIRANISTRNPYYISRDRFYELKHFCLQYKDWLKKYQDIRKINSKYLVQMSKDQIEFKNPILDQLISTDRFTRNMQLVEQTAMEADPELYSWIIRGVTEGLPFTALQNIYDMPCCRDTYYDRYRRFFWLLDKRKD